LCLRSEGEYKAKFQELKDGLGFSPLTGSIVAIGIYDLEKNQGAVYYQAQGEENEDFAENGIKFSQGNERELLLKFWKAASRYDKFVSFNGRSFDAPFLMVRSAIHKVRPSLNLMPNRYLSLQKGRVNHIDLLDQLTFYGAVRRKGNLHLWCRAFGIKSPKADGITGDDVGKLFKDKRYIDIAKYNVGDLKATKELYEYWRDYINFE